MSAGPQDESFDWMTVDWPGGGEGLRARSEATLAAWERSGGRPADRYVGMNSSRSIQVTVDPHGAVFDVQLSAQWTDRLTPREFPRSLLQAYLSAIGTATAAGYFASKARGEERDDSAHHVDDAGEQDVEYEQTISALEAAIWRSDQRERAYSDQVAEREYLSPGEFLRLHLRGVQLVNITAGSKSVGHAYANELRSDCLNALRALDSE